MEDFSQLLRLVDDLKHRHQSCFLGIDASNNPVFARMDETVGVLGGPRKYKTTSSVVPSVAIHPGPVIVTSTRPDIIRATRPAREAISRQYGGEVIEMDFDPNANSLVKGTHVWSVLDGFSTYAECAQLAETFVKTALTNPDHDHWIDSAKRLMISYMYAAKIYGHTFTEMVDVIFAPRQGEKSSFGSDEDGHRTPQRLNIDAYAHALRRLAELMRANAPGYHPGAQLPNRLEIASQPWDFLYSIFTQGRAGTDERGSILSFVSRLLEPWHGKKMLDLPSFDVSRLVNSHSTIYITIPSLYADQLAPAVVSFLTAIEREWNRVNAGKGPLLDAPLLLALDETANVSPIPRLASLLSEGGGNSIQTITVFQDPNQVRSRWPRDAESILNLPNHKLLFGAVDDFEYLDKVSKLSGIRYERNIEPVVLQEYIHSPRMAGAARLIAERGELEEATSDSTVVGREQYEAQWELYSKLTAARFEDGFQIRSAYYLDDPDDHVSAFIREVYGLTNIEYSRDRYQNVEVEDLAHIPPGVAYRRSDSESVFTDMPRWFDSPYWMQLFGSRALEAPQSSL